MVRRMMDRPAAAAESAALATAGLFGLSLAEWDQVAQIASGFGALVAGLAAAYFYVKQANRPHE